MGQKDVFMIWHMILGDLAVEIVSMTARSPNYIEKRQKARNAPLLAKQIIFLVKIRRENKSFRQRETHFWQKRKPCFARKGFIFCNYFWYVFVVWLFFANSFCIDLLYCFFVMFFLYCFFLYCFLYCFLYSFWNWFGDFMSVIICCAYFYIYLLCLLVVLMFCIVLDSCWNWSWNLDWDSCIIHIYIYI